MKSNQIASYHGRFRFPRALYSLCTKSYERLTRFEKAKKNVEGNKGRSAILNGKLNDKEPINLWWLVENVAHAPNKLPQQSAFQLLISLKFTDISGNISVSSTPTRSTRLKRNQSAN